MEEYKLPETKLSIRNEEIASSVLNLLTSSLPFVGPALAEGLFNYWGKVKQERINNFVIELKEYFENVSDSDIDEEFIRSEDYAQLFEHVLRKVSENKSEQKLKIFKDVLLSTIKLKEVDEYAESFLSLVSQLTVKQIEALKIIYRVGLNANDLQFKLNSIDTEISKKKEVKQARDLYQGREVSDNEGLEPVFLNRKLVLFQMKIAKQKKETDYADFIRDYNEIYMLDLYSKGLIEWSSPATNTGLLRSLFITAYGSKFIEYIVQR